MTTGSYISGAAHLALMAWLLLGGLLHAPDPEIKLEVADVSLISSAEFAALTLSDISPDAALDVTGPAPPKIDASPVPPPRPDSAPDLPGVAQPGVPTDPDALPDVPETPVPGDTQAAQDVATLVQPPQPDFSTPDLPATDTPPRPRDAPRVAPVPVPDMPVAPEIADTPSPRVSPDAQTEQTAPDTPAVSPQEATTEIVTEADTPASSAPAVSPRPLARPVRGPANAGAVADAGANATSGDTPTAQPTPVAPSGPPLTRGEKEGLRVAVRQCWNVGSLSSEALNVTVIVAFSMTREARPLMGSIRMQSASGGSDAAARQAYEAARRAIIRCGSRGYGLPVEKYSQWRDIEITFNPERMRIK